MNNDILKQKFKEVRQVNPGLNYVRGLGILKKQHRNDVITKLDNIIKKLEKFEISTQYKNHPLKGSNYYELHVTDDVLLVYKYDFDILYVDLDLYDLLNHKQLKRKY